MRVAHRLTWIQHVVGVRLLGRAVAGLLIACLFLWNLSSPPLWWDEGWTLSVARNWVERGFYGRLLDGQLAPPGLEASFPVTAPIAFMFRLFGVGIWQGRLFGVLSMLSALILIYYLGVQLYNRSVANGALVILLLMSVHTDLNPLLMARQALAEPPMLGLLLAGYACLLLALRRSWWWLWPMIILWGLALETKLQAVPFWAISLAIPLAVMGLKRRWRVAVPLGVGLLGAPIIYELAVWYQAWLLRGHTLPVVPIDGLYRVLAIVPTSYNRLYALYNLIGFGLPALIGLVYTARRSLRARPELSNEIACETVRLALVTLCLSWLAWYALLSVGLPRYLFPVTFLSSIFASAWLYDLTDQFDAGLMLRRLSVALRTWRFDRQVLVALLAGALVMATIPATLQTIYRDYILADNHAVQDVADFINTRTPIDVRIETYEAELHFLLNRQYHYPPDQIHVGLNRRSLLGEQVTIDYDPLAADPDYLVVGGFARWNKLYQPAIESGAFRLLRRFGIYDLYERVRS